MFANPATTQKAHNIERQLIKYIYYTWSDTLNTRPSIDEQRTQRQSTASRNIQLAAI